MSEKGKSILTAVIITLVLLIPIGIVFTVGFSASPHSASPHEVNRDLTAMNPALEYTRHYYDLPLSDSSEHFWNLSRTNTPEGTAPQFAAGWKLLTSTDDMAAFEADYEAARDRAAQSGITAILRGLTSVTEEAYDGAFFAEHDLLLVDLCKEGAVRLYFYPEKLKINGETVSLEVRYDHDNAYTADSAGQYVLIPIPKGCTMAEVKLIRDRW